MGATQYDHVVVAIDNDRCLHVSYPIAKLVPTRIFIQKEKNPLILRPLFSS